MVTFKFLYYAVFLAIIQTESSRVKAQMPSASTPSLTSFRRSTVTPSVALQTSSSAGANSFPTGVNFPPVGSLKQDFSPAGLEHLWDIVSSSYTLRRYCRLKTIMRRLGLLSHLRLRPLGSLNCPSQSRLPRRPYTHPGLHLPHLIFLQICRCRKGFFLEWPLRRIKLKALSRTKAKAPRYGTGIADSLTVLLIIQQVGVFIESTLV